MNGFYISLKGWKKTKTEKKHRRICDRALIAKPNYVPSGPLQKICANPSLGSQLSAWKQVQGILKMQNNSDVEILVPAF